MKMIKTIIVEDQGMVLGALSALLELQGGFSIEEEFPDGQQALQYILQNEVELVLTDIEMPSMSGLELAAELHRRLSTPPKIVILSTFSRRGYIERAQKIGVDGYLLKEAPSSDLARSLKKVMRGHKVYDPSLVDVEINRSDPLSDIERKILRRAEQGESTTAIAVSVHRSEGTVRNILSDVIKKLGARNRVEALRLARENGWL